MLDLGLPDMDGITSSRRCVAGPVSRFWCCPPGRRPTRRSTPSTRAPTTTSPSRSAWTNSWRAAGRGAPHRGRAARPETTLVTTDDFTIDLRAKKATRGGRDIRLTPTEWHLLEILVTNPAAFITQKYLLQEVWGVTQSNKTNYLRVYMAQLRRKLEGDPSSPRYLITEPGMGYRFEDDMGRGKLRIYLRCGTGRRQDVRDAVRSPSPYRARHRLRGRLRGAPRPAAHRGDAARPGADPTQGTGVRDTTFTEMDVDGSFARHPEVALVDELPHTNIPGSRNTKRWQDIENCWPPAST